MDDFDTFKASREKMDPTARKMSEHQWEQAYVAYRNARVRVSGSARSSSGERTKKRRDSKSQSFRSGSARDTYVSTQSSDMKALRQQVRGQSAYSDVRLLIDVLAWIAIAVVVLAGVLTLFYYTSVPATLASVMDTLAQVIGIVAARLLVQVLVDIPDIALFRAQQETVRSSSSEANG
ncbi:hypothetical protein QEH59_09070 [Coraliomargarita sp. SDUM461004]|uniref:Uncharacterized protein n=1 Tax=Thalassobacterium sedimentorum TaxID=3041258 RepID=A0ABU1AL55_9BACT|nr:hypothetical protein [Coraliomargarita sp. SDUM461004]MDQ8194575.1 hypothetical protein [Coraliomargarita sp. SDUM461004]